MKSPLAGLVQGLERPIGVCSGQWKEVQSARIRADSARFGLFIGAWRRSRVSPDPRLLDDSLGNRRFVRGYSFCAQVAPQNRSSLGTR